MNAADSTINIKIEFIDINQPLIHWQTNIKSSYPQIYQALPRDIYPIDENNDPFQTQGAIYTKQEGPKAGIYYFTINKPETGTILYMQNFSALNEYFELTQSAPTNTVAGAWPEMGYSPPSNEDKPIPKNKEVTLSDAYVLFSQSIPQDGFEANQQYLDMLVPIYLQLSRPESRYHNYITKAKKAIKDLEESDKCSITVKNQKYLRPYVGTENKPPESMVQLAVLLPLMEYEKWQEEKIAFCDTLLKTLKKFYSKDLQTFVRYLPDVDFSNPNKEPQEDPNTMDSWYLFHPLNNLARLAQKGVEDARKLFFDSIDYAIKGAHKFNYHWPVFYDMKTLKPIAPPDGTIECESDVACIYALTMVHAYELSKDKCYLDEAEAAAKSLDNMGFNLPYQMNVTSFGASAFWRLYKITGNTHYKQLALLCITNMFCSSWLWECEYGYAKNYRTFLGIAPLAKMSGNDYLASYEEMEVLAAFDDLFQIADETEIPASTKLLMAEYSRYLLDRCWSYFPSELPKEMIAEKAKTGHVDPKLAFPIEDMREGWQKAGQIGQEVYGAGGIMITITRHFNHQKNWPFIIYCEYPIKNIELKQDKNQETLNFLVGGDNRLNCHIRILKFNGKKIPQTKLYKLNKESPKEVSCKKTEEGDPEYTIPGATKISIVWSRR